MLAKPVGRVQVGVERFVGLAALLRHADDAASRTNAKRTAGEGMTIDFCDQIVSKWQRDLRTANY